MLDELQTIDLGSLEAVTGGRYTKAPPQLTAQIMKLFQGLQQEIKAMGQGLAQSKNQQFGQMMQFVQKMYEDKQGGPPRKK
jgi:hypothetical protein